MKLVHGIGVNDADYVVEIKEKLFCEKSGKFIRKTIWSCPFYVKWKSMLARCYSETMLLKNPSYVGCSVAPEWHYLMAFRAWMEQ